MAHVEQTRHLHSLVAMPPHAWSTQHQLSTSHSLPPAIPPLPPSAEPHSNLSWNSSHPTSTAQLPPPSLPPDPPLPTDHPDHLNADTIFRDLLNLRIATDNQPSPPVPAQSHLPTQPNSLSTQIAPHSSLLHHDHFPRSDPEPDHLDPNHHIDPHPEHSLNHFSSHPSALPFLHTHINPNPNQSHDPSLTDSISISLPPPFTSHTAFSSTQLSTRRQSSQPSFRTPPILPQHPRPSNVPRSHPPSAPSHAGPRIKNDLYKTEICRSFAENSGFCKYGSKCQFAHGEEELRPVRRHPRYKTKLCRNFVNNGSCPYDTRCRFIHANDLPYVSVPTLPALHQSPISATPASESADSSKYETSELMGDHYAENLRRILSLTPSASAAPDASAGDRPVPLPSPYPSHASEVDTDHSSLNTPLKKPPSHRALTEQQAVQGNPSVPDDHIYQPSASPFRKYPDRALSQPFVPIAPAKSEDTISSSKSRDESVSAVTDSTGIKIARPSPIDFTANEIFAPERKSAHTATTSVNQVASSHEPVKLAADRSGNDKISAITSSTAARARLPVFRNMTSNGDSA